MATKLTLTFTFDIAPNSEGVESIQIEGTSEFAFDVEGEPAMAPLMVVDESIKTLMGTNEIFMRAHELAPVTSEMMKKLTEEAANAGND